jgi:hypothetical protein
MLGNLFALQGPASPCEHNATLNQPPSRVCAQKRKVARTRPASAASLAAGAHNRLSRTIQPTKTPTRHQTDMLDPAQQKAPSFKHCMRAAEPACSSPWGAAALGGGLSATVTCPVLCSMHAQPPCLRHTKRQQHAFPGVSSSWTPLWPPHQHEPDSQHDAAVGSAAASSLRQRPCRRCQPRPFTGTRCGARREPMQIIYFLHCTAMRNAVKAPKR